MAFFPLQQIGRLTKVEGRPSAEPALGKTECLAGTEPMALKIPCKHFFFVGPAAAPLDSGCSKFTFGSLVQLRRDPAAWSHGAG
jgi:hypothetical protein